MTAWQGLFSWYVILIKILCDKVLQRVIIIIDETSFYIAINPNQSDWEKINF